MARSLGLPTIAQRTETTEQCERLMLTARLAGALP